MTNKTTIKLTLVCEQCHESVSFDSTKSHQSVRCPSCKHNNPGPVEIQIEGFVVNGFEYCEIVPRNDLKDDDFDCSGHWLDGWQCHDFQERWRELIEDRNQVLSPFARRRCTSGSIGPISFAVVRGFLFGPSSFGHCGWWKHKFVVTELVELRLATEQELTRSPEAKHLNLETTLESRLARNQASQITDATLEQLRSYPALESLNLVGSRITDLGLKHVALLENLTHLWLRRTLITDSGLAYITGLKNLNTLSLDETEITDDGCDSLSMLTNLKSLGLAGTKISDAGLMKLKSLRKLEYVSANNTCVTEQGKEMFRYEMPSCCFG